MTAKIYEWATKQHRTSIYAHGATNDADVQVQNHYIYKCHNKFSPLTEPI